ncbi:NAD-dependent epimerase/dehydratase family protein [Flavobacterium sp. ANB]|uniref:NAD-dependent epimerase/dehydratase family protein n=1 Tax=unclassified Flavobacterium TaxID=196869 RepID=UPI0012B6DB94|nr:MULTISPECIES: NAD-dependent epimerase/dehydratase family protein [unclassified Flavobacterium]MBF4515917.1 NAD-dependent epimerase/dehydratase family protein [Flavobacterium sp. ANB]MTD68919.1 NAD-dependent epimerase/dehydratase family protein [Flavobacterium sp. LC2016-13]
MKVIITGATGMVGEGVLLECLENSAVEKVLMVNRKSSPLKHPKLAELIVPDFMNLESFTSELTGYDACFYCAGISSVGMNEEKFTQVTYDTTIYFAGKLASLNPDMVFTYVSGTHTDSSEKGKIMWARVKGKTENDLIKLPFKGVYNYRPGFMKPFKEQKNVKTFFKPIIFLFLILLPKRLSLTLKEVGQAMINNVNKGYPKNILEIEDIKIAAK